ncbi:MAG: 16S rRNA pseudouridine(516) synthase [Clostridiales bacterium]|nr:16S rRNA pseudouridine(516) synthase [Clostridiales bacterium]
MERIDKIISKQTYYTRKETKKLISQGMVYVNGEQVKKTENKYDENNISLKINGKEIEIRKHIYLLLNKPKGYVSSTEDKSQKTVLDLVPEEYKNRNLFPAGRLDKDTTGLMLITDDGEFAHNILSPRKHVKKEYEVTLDIPVTLDIVEGFKQGVKLNDGECKSAELEITGKYTAKVTITEGRYHQIKRMFGCYGAKVIELNRICMGNLYLPKELKLGEIKEATEMELQKIQERS